MLRLRLTILLFLGLTVLVACGGSGGSTSLTLEEYLQTLVEKQAEAEQVAQALEAEFDAKVETVSDAEVAALYRGLLTESADLARGYLADLQRLEPPSVAVDAAVEYVRAVDALMAAIDATVSETEGATTRAEVDDVYFWAVSPAAVMIDEACLTLQQIADDNDVAIDLECEV